MFKYYLNDLLEQIRLGELFGGTAMYILAVVEFQKRGLPHAHVAFRVAGNQPMTAAELDEFVSARVPDVPTEESLLQRMGSVPPTPAHCSDDARATLEFMRAIRATVPRIATPAAGGNADLIVDALRAQAPPAAFVPRRGPATELQQRCTAMFTILEDAADDYDTCYLVKSCMLHRRCIPERCYKRRETARTSALPQTRTYTAPQCSLLPRTASRLRCCLSQVPTRRASTAFRSLTVTSPTLTTTVASNISASAYV